MKLVSTLLANDASPCSERCSGSVMSPLTQACCNNLFGSEDNQLQMVQLLLDHGADPGELQGSETLVSLCTTIHAAAERRLWKVLEVLLKSDKGRAGVNNKMRSTDYQNECTSISLCLEDEKIESKNATYARRCAALLLQYGADVQIPDAQDRPPYYGLTVVQTPKIQQLLGLVDRAPNPDDTEIVFAYWSSAEVQQWIGTGASTRKR